MAKTKNYLGIDIGSSEVRVVMAQEVSDDEPLRVLASISEHSEGMRKGTVVDQSAMASAISRAVAHAERVSGVTADVVCAGISGIDIFCQKTLGVVAVSRPDGEVADADVDRVIAEVETRVMSPSNRSVLHVVPKSYRLDDQKDIKDPVGMHGVRLEAEAFVVGTGLNQMRGIERILDQAGIRPDYHAVEPLAAAEAVLNAKQRELGIALINIGGSTTSLAVYEEGELIHLAVIPIGGMNVTNDIALRFRVNSEIAEQIKLKYGTAMPNLVGKGEEIDLSQLDSHETESVSRYEVAEYIEARMDELFRFVNSELEKCGREGLLPAGAVLTGGGALLPGTVETAKAVLRLPSSIGYPKPLGGLVDQVDGPDFATAVGLVLLARERNRSGGFFASGKKVPEWVSSLGGKMRDFLRKFLPLD
jgi:cell division protein FtsA